MLDIKTAYLIKNVIDKKVSPDAVTMEDVCRMEPIQVSTKTSGYTILGTQCGDLTILVWVQFSDLGACVRAVKTMAW